MVVDDFLCWVETARTSERVSAANALARAFVQARFEAHERRAAEMALACLLDDPSLAVRLSLAKGLACAEKAPRAIILTLCEDQLEIACTVITQSPVLTDDDLVDLAAKGGTAQRVMIASRASVSKSVAAAIIEIGKGPEVLQLLQNPGCELSRLSLSRIADRFGDVAEIRHILLKRNDLPSSARHLLVEKVSAALGAFGLVRETIGAQRTVNLMSDATESATVIMAGDAEEGDVEGFVEHLRAQGKLTPAFMMRALCSGQAEFFAEAVSNLSGVTARRVRSILAEGRPHAIRALMESTGIGRDISELYLQCILLWRRQAAGSAPETGVALALVEWSRGRRDLSPSAEELLDLAERIGVTQMRSSARQYAVLTRQAA